MSSKAINLLELLGLIIEDDKTRTGAFIDPEVLKEFQKNPEWRDLATNYSKKSSEATSEEDRLTYANMAMGYIPSVLNQNQVSAIGAR